MNKNGISVYSLKQKNGIVVFWPNKLMSKVELQFDEEFKKYNYDRTKKLWKLLK